MRLFFQAAPLGVLTERTGQSSDCVPDHFDRAISQVNLLRICPGGNRKACHEVVVRTGVRAQADLTLMSHAAQHHERVINSDASQPC